MQEKTLRLFAMGCSLMGIVVLYLFMLITPLQEVTVSELSVDDLDSQGVLNGTVIRVRSFGNVTSLTIAQQNTIDITLFNAPSVGFNEGDVVRVEGRVDEYQGKFQIIAELVEKIK